MRDLQEVDLFPASFAQERLWFLDQFEPGSFIYNIPSALRLQGRLALPALLQSIHALLSRHETLRTTFVDKEGRPMQAVTARVAITASTLPLIDLSSLVGAERVLALQSISEAEAQRPFDLAHGPLLRLTLLRLEREEHRLLLTFHHSIADGWSITIFFRELNLLYAAFQAGKPAPLPELPIQYADYAVWQREWLQGETLEQELAYWKNQLAGIPSVLELPTDHLRPAMQTFKGARHFLQLSPSLTKALQALCRKQGVTLFMVLLAAFQTLLSRYSGQQDVVVGTPIAGRTQLELEGLIGFFANTLVLRSDLSADPPFSIFLEEVRDMTLEAYTHQELPFDRVVEALAPERSLRYSPLFQVLFSFQKSAAAQPSITSETPALQAQDVNTRMETAKFDLSLFFFEEADGLSGELEYNTDLFEKATIERWAKHLNILLEGIVAHPEQRLSALPLLSEGERQELLNRWSETSSPIAASKCIHQLFEEQVERRPNAIALVSAEGKKQTYAEVELQANQLAQRLQKLGIGPEQRVALFVERSPEVVVGILAILKAGGAYVPIDPASPLERVAIMLADAQVAVLLTQEALFVPLAATQTSDMEHVKVLCIDRDHDSIANEPMTRPVSGVLPGNLAYIIYTSGSTGQPKGVGVCHEQVVRLLAVSQDDRKGRPYISFDEQDCWTLFHSISFDFSVWEIWGALLYGGRLLVVPYWVSRSPEEFAALLIREQVTVLNQTPSAFYALQQALAVDGRADALPLRLVIFGGEALDIGRLQHWMQTHDDRHPQLVNMYGITETTVHVTQYALDKATVLANEGASIIGKPLSDLQIYLLDTQMQPVPVGTRGEVYVGGAGLARGYVEHPDLTAGRFLPHPFSTKPGARLYRTGDVARYLPDGTFEYVGRADQQVKVRGFRIEPGEIEVALLGHPEVRMAVVVAREAMSGGKHLVAYIVPAPAQAIAIPELRAYLQERLPEYMVPAAFMQLETLPMTINGKLDRQALPEPETAQRDTVRAYTPPQTPSEQILAGIWSEVLHSERVDIHTSFFEMGGDSILSLLVIAKARQAGLSLTPKQIFQHQTIAALAKVAGSSTAGSDEQEAMSGLVPLTPIQHWFFEQELVDPQHWNQSTLLAVIDPRVDIVVLEQAIVSLLEHHPALSLRFQRGEQGWEQYNASEQEYGTHINSRISTTDIIRSVDISELSTTDQERVLEEEATQAQASLHLTDGPLLRAVYFFRGEQQQSRLLLVIHHLVVDAVSWRILREDLNMACQQVLDGKPVQLPAKTTSFQTWARQLLIYAQTTEVRRQADYWLIAGRHDVPALPVDFSAELNTNTEAAARTVELSLGATETNALLHDVAAAYHTEINELLLTALVLACVPWTGRRRLLVDMEGHGREAVFDGVDLSRTVGWFTTIFPVLLDLETVPSSAGLGNALKAIKEQVRALPQHGIGYGLLRYLHEDQVKRNALATLQQAEISFNYLGQFDAAPSVSQDDRQGHPYISDHTPSNVICPAHEGSGPSHSLRGRRRYLLEVTCMVAQGRFHMEWRYSAELHRRETIEALAQRYVETLRAVIAHCQTPGVGSYTPSDFSGAGLNQAKLDKIMTKIRATKRTET